MKKRIKKIALIIGILFSLFTLAICLLIWFIFTPEKLTPIVQKKAKDFITCGYEIGEVELTFFSTFPEFGLKINQLKLINPTKGSKKDTILQLDELVGIIDVKEYLINDKINLNEFHLNNGKVNSYISKLGKSNFDIFVPDTSASDEAPSEINLINLKNIAFNNLSISHIDESIKLSAFITDFTASLSGRLENSIFNSEFLITQSNITLNYDGTTYFNKLKLALTLPYDIDIKKESILFKDAIMELNGNQASFKGLIKNNSKTNAIYSDLIYSFEDWDINEIIKLIPSEYSSSFNQSKLTGMISSNGSVKGSYTDSLMPFILANISMKNGGLETPNIAIPLSAINSSLSLYSDFTSDEKSYFKIHELDAWMKNTRLNVKGLVKNIFSDPYCEIKAKSTLVLEELVALMPKPNPLKIKGKATTTLETSFSQSQLEKFISKLGQSNPALALTSLKKELKHKLILKLSIENTEISTSDIPFPVKDIAGDFEFNTDLESDEKTYFTINQLNAKTPKSVFRLKGGVSKLLSTIEFNLTSTSDLFLNELNTFIPKDLKLNLSGRMKGDIKTTFNLAQLEKMLLEKMKFSGSLAFTAFNMNFDKLNLKSPSTSLEFSLPNTTKRQGKESFLYAKIKTKQLESSQEKEYYTQLKNAIISIETSDIRSYDKQIPFIHMSYFIDSLSLKTSDINASLKTPNGQLSISPQKGKPLQAEINLAYSSDKINAQFDGNSTSVGSIKLNVDLLNDPTKKEILDQWQYNGSLDVSNSEIELKDFIHTFTIPELSLNFSPNLFLIKQSQLKIDKSDFRLTGRLSNILSYISKDSILRGDFNFQSNTTDVNQLMNLTNGIGSDEVKSSSAETTPESGPYMVPKGIDIALKTSINKAIVGKDVFSKLSGYIRVKDGVLILDNYSFTSPAAETQLTAIYKTPRKNHLYLGLDYHMRKIEIDALLKMIPDIDSMMPMLKSFKGKGEFHLAVETNLDSLYNVKKSTIRAASSIKGQDLVLMDGPTFKEISKTLKFNKQTKNKIDSLTTEFTVFKQEIDIYPFIIVMDKYKAIIEGRHNLDMNFNYHISLIESPIPIKISVDILGNGDKLKFTRGKSKYSTNYIPVAQKALSERQLDIRKIIKTEMNNRIRP